MVARMEAQDELLLQGQGKRQMLGAKEYGPLCRQQRQIHRACDIVADSPEKGALFEAVSITR